MQVKIGYWEDLKVGDVWLGLTIVVVGFNGHVHFSPNGCDLWYHQIDGLIAAGNDTVERKPERPCACIRQGFVDLEYDCGHSYGGKLCLHNLPESIVGPCRVTIEPLEDK